MLAVQLWECQRSGDDGTKLRCDEETEIKWGVKLAGEASKRQGAMRDANGWNVIRLWRKRSNRVYICHANVLRGGPWENRTPVSAMRMRCSTN